jgi:hypothetical protein
MATSYFDILNTGITAASTLGGVYIGYVLESNRSIITERTNEVKQSLETMTNIKAEINYLLTMFKASYADCLINNQNAMYRQAKYYCRRDKGEPLEENEYEHMLDFMKKNADSIDQYNLYYADFIRQSSKFKVFMIDEPNNIDKVNELNDIIGILSKLELHPYTTTFDNCKTEKECDDLALSISEKTEWKDLILSKLITPALEPIDKICTSELSRYKTQETQLVAEKKKVLKRNNLIMAVLGICLVIMFGVISYTVVK